MESLKVFLFFVPFFIPLFFQILFGSGFIPVSRKMKFGLVCVISVLLLFVTYFIYAKMMSYNMAKSGIKDGLPFVGLFMIESIMAIAVALTILIQILVKYFRNRKKS
jgi:uncharacterized membrane protein